MQNGVSSSFITASDGLRLHARCYGARTASATPVVCLPGLARTAADFETLASALSAGALGNWDEIVFPAMAGDGPIPQLLTSALGSRGWSVEMKMSGACPYIALPGFRRSSTTP